MVSVASVVCSVTLQEIQRNFFFYPKPASGDMFCRSSMFSAGLCRFIGTSCRTCASCSAPETG